jgi:Helix-loop-helix DNA-binding domain.
MTQEAIPTPKANERLDKYFQGISVKIEDNSVPHDGTSKRHRRKPMKSFSKSKHDSYRSSYREAIIVDENNNINETTSFNREVIDIEEECVKAKASISKEHIGVKRKRGCLDQLLSRVVAKKNKEGEKINQQIRRETIVHSTSTTNQKERKDTYSHHDFLHQTRNETISESGDLQLPDKRIIKSSRQSFQQRQTLTDIVAIEEKRRRRKPMVVVYEPIKHYIRQIDGSVRLVDRNEKVSNFDQSFSQPETIYYASSAHRKLSSSSSSSHGGGGSRDDEEDVKTSFSNKPNTAAFETATTTTIAATDNNRYSKLNNNQLQRRLVANARERSRVHALSNAFDALRSTIPSYSSEQKLSKLTILRVAINYIDALTQLLAPKTPITQRRFERCVDECTAVLQTEYGRSKTK